MKVCFASEFFHPSFGGQYTSVKSVIDICKLNKIEYSIIHKNSIDYKDKKKLEKKIQKSDIVHIFGGWTLFYINVTLQALKLKKKILVHPMGFYEPWAFTQKRIKKSLAWNFYQKKILLKADLIHCASVNEEKSLIELDRNFKTIVLPFGINKKDIKKNINQNFNKKCLFFSRLHKKKGLDNLLKAWTELNNSKWKIDIIGYGDQNYYKKKYKLDKNKNIKFLKPISNKNKKFTLFDKYDFLILPSSNENFGIVILEALARGLPVLTTNETPWNEIQEKDAGWIINDSLVELKILLYKIFESSKKDMIIKKKNTIKISKYYTKENLSKLYVKTYKKLFIN